MIYFHPSSFSDNRFRLYLNYEYEATNVREILDKLMEVSMRALWKEFFDVIKNATSLGFNTTSSKYESTLKRVLLIWLGMKQF